MEMNDSQWIDYSIIVHIMAVMIYLHLIALLEHNP